MLHVLFIIHQTDICQIMKVTARMSTICTDTCLEMLFTFQQDSALTHHARETIGLLQHETFDFIPHNL